MRTFLLGYDVEPSAAKQAASTLGDSADSITGILQVFADVTALAPEPRPSDDEDEQLAPREYFNQYLRSLDPDARASRRGSSSDWSEPSPTSGSTTLRRPELHDALMRLFVAQQRMDDQLAVVTTLLERGAATCNGDDDAACVTPSTG